jgi:hypothetical protein
MGDKERRTIELELSELAWGMSASTMEQALEKEALRLWHIERSKPRERDPKPLGRPRKSQQDKAVEELAEVLTSIYLKLQAVYGTGFDTTFGTQMEHLRTAVANKDFEALQEMLRLKPWTKR